MILLVGSSNDDILYFSSILKNKKEVSILNQFTAYTGEIFNQSVILVKDVYSSYVSGLVTSYIIEKYMAILVIDVGEIQAYTDTLSIGDIVIAKDVYISDVNLTDVEKVSKGQIKGFQQSFQPSTEITNSISEALLSRSGINAKGVSYISRNYHPENKDQLNDIQENNKLFGIQEDTVLSSEIGGIAVAAKLHDVPFAAISVVGRKVGADSQIEDYLHVLDQYTNVGKAVVSVIGEIGRTDIVKM